MFRFESIGRSISRQGLIRLGHARRQWCRMNERARRWVARSFLLSPSSFVVFRIIISISFLYFLFSFPRFFITSTYIFLWRWYRLVVTWNSVSLHSELRSSPSIFGLNSVNSIICCVYFMVCLLCLLRNMPRLRSIYLVVRLLLGCVLQPAFLSAVISSISTSFTFFLLLSVCFSFDFDTIRLRFLQSYSNQAHNQQHKMSIAFHRAHRFMFPVR